MNSIIKKEPPLETKMAQAKATNPENNVWVSANAGSGKTYVLARRVIRLMLQGTKPSQILCLTFTKAAAAEMSNRVFEILSSWTVMPERELAEAVEEVIGQKPNTKMLVRARQMFALALDTPGGLKIQTIHAFCDALLHQFPLEANVPAHFDQLDTPEQNALLEEAQRNIILKSLGRGFSDRKEIALLTEAFATIRNYASEDAIEKTLNELINQRDAFSQWVGADLSKIMDAVWNKFQMNRTDRPEDIAAGFDSESNFSDDELKEYAIEMEADGGKTLIKLCATINELLRCTDPLDKLEIRKSIYFNKDGSLSAQFGTKKFTNSFSDLREKFEAEQILLTQQMDRLKTVECLKASEALFTITQAILVEYSNLKQRRGKLDFNDLIRKAADLLTRNEIQAWVQYKLDRGIDHVLVDEAQDTSPLQWEVINAITEEFYSGKGARLTDRTLFVVGDEKQSIYSFQGADPQEFKKQSEFLETKSAGADVPFEPVSLELSFRSTQEILSAVDQVFSLKSNRHGLSMLGDLSPHTAQRGGEKGEVILWPIVRKPNNPKKEHWLKPPDKRDEEAEITLANRIASEIKSWIDSKAKLPGRNTPIRAGDILILLRKRDRFASAITKALKAQNLPTAGADRLKLTEHIVAEDMMALGRFVMMQSDDLSLAALLKSPIFGFDEDELFEVSYKRKQSTLFASLLDTEDKATTLKAKMTQVHTILGELIVEAQRTSVFEFYAGLFARNNLRKLYLERLGNEAEDVIDGFLQAAINHDNNLGTGLIAFIEWLNTATPEIKREIDLKTDEIRVITVHSSKGLEAPIVFLVDPCSAAVNSSHLPKIAEVEDVNGNAAFIWQPTNAKQIVAGAAFLDKVKLDAEKEYRRLLYVGMTRAADRLIVCGYGKEDIKHEHWHSMVEEGLEAPNIDATYKGYLKDDLAAGGFEVRKWIIENKAHHDVDLLKKENDVTTLVRRPSWLFEPITQEQKPPKPLTPSGVLNLLEISTELTEHDFSNKTENGSALVFGNAVHALLQILPEIEASKHETTIDAYLSTFAETLDKTQRERARSDLLQLMSNVEMKSLLAKPAKVEAYINGKVKLGSKEHMVHGQIDRLIIKPDEIILVDYKTNLYAPKSVDGIAAEYLAQLGLYRLLLKKIYPDQKIRTLLIWVSNASIMDVPEDLIDKQLQLIT